MLQLNSASVVYNYNSSASRWDTVMSFNVIYSCNFIPVIYRWVEDRHYIKLSTIIHIECDTNLITMGFKEKI